MSEIIFSISYFLLLRLASSIPVHVQNLLFLDFPYFGFIVFIIFLLLGLKMFCSFSSTVCGFIDFFDGLIYFFFKGLCFIHPDCFQVFALCISYVANLRVYYTKAAGV